MLDTDRQTSKPPPPKTVGEDIRDGEKEVLPVADKAIIPAVKKVNIKFKKPPKEEVEMMMNLLEKYLANNSL